MTSSISESPDLQARLVALMGQGGTFGNFPNYNALEPPKKSDIAAFKAASDPGALQMNNEIDRAQSSSTADSVGNSKATVAFPEVYNAGSAQQTDRANQSASEQQNNKSVEKGEGSSSADKAKMVEQENKNKKEGEIGTLMARIQQLMGQLQAVEGKINVSAGVQSSGGDSSGSSNMGELITRRNDLSSQIQQLQVQLQGLMSE